MARILKIKKNLKYTHGEKLGSGGLGSLMEKSQFGSSVCLFYTAEQGGGVITYRRTRR